MQYICLVYHEEEKLKALSDCELAAVAAECAEWVAYLERRGSHVYSVGLQSVRAAATLRNRNGRLSVTDGPFAETKEFLGGFTILNARDLNEAMQLASKLPAVRIGSVEVRPVLGQEEDLTDPLDRKLTAAMRDCLEKSCRSEYGAL